MVVFYLRYLSGTFPSGFAFVLPVWGTKTKTPCTSSTPWSHTSTSPPSRDFKRKTLNRPPIKANVLKHRHLFFISGKFNKFPCVKITFFWLICHSFIRNRAVIWPFIGRRINFKDIYRVNTCTTDFFWKFALMEVICLRTVGRHISLFDNSLAFNNSMLQEIWIKALGDLKHYRFRLD